MVSPALLAHQQQAPRPHDVWTAWNSDLVVVLGVVAAIALFARGQHGAGPGGRRQHAVGAAGVGAIVLALLSPLDALGSALASAHMLQHIVLILVAAPLLVTGGALSTMAQGLPSSVRRAGQRAAGSSAATSVLHALRRPGAAWLLHVGALWLWHSAALYEAALRSHWLHGLEHVSFFATALLFWSVVLRRQPGPDAFPGVALVLVFTMALQSVLLSALLTFSPTPWYPSYGERAAPWGLDPLVDQQLAGVMMWVPGGLVYLGIALVLLISGIRHTPARLPAPADHGRRRSIDSRTAVRPRSRIPGSR
jgi:putative membrane protein